MSLIQKTEELNRLIAAFETEASKFRTLTLTTFYVTQQGESLNRPISNPNHAIMLWQYYGAIAGKIDVENLVTNLQESELKWGVRGSELARFGILEGDGCGLFVQMAQRAGALFDEKETAEVKSRFSEELIFQDNRKQASEKPVVVSNDNPLAIWINYLLYHLSLSNPGRERAQQIEPDPFSLSLIALERLRDERAIGKIDKSRRPLKEINFQVAMSFPGEHRSYVAKAVECLRKKLGVDAVFYDHDYQAQLARPNLDTLLQGIYRNQARLIIVFLSGKYAEKQWCGLEWRAIRDLIKSKNDEQIMFVRFDDEPVEGVFSIDGYIDGRKFGPIELAEFVMTRLAELS